MWLAVKTDVFSEHDSIDFLRREYPSVIRDVYFPVGRREYVDGTDSRRVRFLPLLHGLFFINVESEKSLLPILSQYGYFVYRERGVDGRVGRVGFTKSHLLCADAKDMSLGSIISRAVIPSDDMERFIYYNEQVADGIEGLSIIGKRYRDLVRENDTVRILNGPLQGWTGVVRQVKRNGRKDRHLLVRFGNDYCMSIPDIRKYDFCVEHEATEGGRSEAVGAWRAIDQLVGWLQASRPDDDAPATLRRLLMDYNSVPRLRRCGDTTAAAHASREHILEEQHHAEVLACIDRTMQGNFRILANFFCPAPSSSDEALREFVSDLVLRPFLTPTPGIDVPDDAGYALLRHNGIVEVVVRQNLRRFFRDREYDADKYAPVFDEDYEYYAHFALLPKDDGCVKAVCSWGGFYDRYATLTDGERRHFLADLRAKGYHRMCSLLEDCILPPQKQNCALSAPT